MTATASAQAPSTERPAFRVDWRLVMLALVVVQLLWRTWALSQSFFWQDDFLYVDRAGQGLGWDYLLQDYNDHLMPVQFLSVWAVTSLGPLDWTLAAGLVLVLQALASLAVVQLARTLVGDGIAAVVLVALYCFNPLTFTASVWWASALQSVPLQLCAAVALTFWVRQVRHGRRRDSVMIVLVYVLGLLWWQKALLLAPLLLAVLVLVGSDVAGEPLRSVLRRARGWVAAVAVVTVGYLAGYLTLVDQSASRWPSAGEVLAVLRLGVGETFVPALLGATWGSEPDWPLLAPDPPFALLLVVWQVAAVVVVATIVLARATAVRAWLLLGAYLAVDLALVAGTRLDFVGTLIARDARYTADAVVVAVFVLGVIVLGVRARTPVDRTAAPSAGPSASSPSTIAGLLLVALVLNGSLVASVRIVERLPMPAAEAFVAGAREALQLPGGIDLVDGPVPAEVVHPVFVDDARVSVVVSALPGDVRFGAATNDLRMLDGLGTPRQVELRTAVTSTPTDDPCPRPVRAGRTTVPLAEPVPTGRWVVRVGYYAGAPTAGVMEVDGRAYEVRLLEGVHHLAVEVTGAVRDVSLGSLAARGAVCVTDVAVGVPWPRQDG